MTSKGFCIQPDNKFEWLFVWFGISDNCGDVCLNGVRQNRETDEEHDENCVEDKFQLARVKFYKDGERGREALGIWIRNINI